MKKSHLMYSAKLVTFLHDVEGEDFGNEDDKKEDLHSGHDDVRTVINL